MSHPSLLSRAPLARQITYVRTLMASLSGEVLLVRVAGRLAALKVSRVELLVGTMRSASGVAVVEDVRREVRVMRLLQTPFGPLSICHATHGLSNGCMSRSAFARVEAGRHFIVGLHDAFEDEASHFVLTEYAVHGDLITLLGAGVRSAPSVRRWLFQLCSAVRYMHARSVAHLDISLENVCVASDGSARLIDMGQASLHHSFRGARRSRYTSPFLRARGAPRRRSLSEPPPRCRRRALRFICEPCTQQVHIFGKRGYESPEVFAGACWDAYASDVYAIGVLMYRLCTGGHVPYRQPDTRDWAFASKYSGLWLASSRAQGEAACVQDLIDSILKPQHARPHIDTVMRHAYFAGLE